ncbi:metallophosphoesterase [Bacillota bacterium Lsc_1132]
MKHKIVFRMAVALLLYSVLVYYIAWNGWIWLHNALGLEVKWIYYSIAGLVSYSYIIGHEFKKLSTFKIIGAYWFAVLQYSILLLPIADLSAWLLRFSGLAKQTAVIWTGAAVLVILAFIFIYGTYNAYNPVIRSYSIAIPKQANIPRLRIVMASDMHFGRLSGISHLRRLVKEINKLKPDLILLPGDIIDDDPEPFIRKNMGDILKELSAPLGVYGVLGNHEYYGGAIPKFVQEMERIGITILQDTMVKIADSLYLVGRKDKTDSERLTIKDLISELDASRPIMMMDHQPTELALAEQHKVDLLLSGHTHRGQMAPNHLITRRVFELDWGYLKRNQLHAIVSSGYGFWGPPLRIGSRSEIIQIQLTFHV